MPAVAEDQPANVVGAEDERGEHQREPDQQGSQGQRRSYDGEQQQEQHQRNNNERHEAHKQRFPGPGDQLVRHPVQQAGEEPARRGGDQAEGNQRVEQAEQPSCEFFTGSGFLIGLGNNLLSGAADRAVGNVRFV